MRVKANFPVSSQQPLIIGLKESQDGSVHYVCLDAKFGWSSLKLRTLIFFCG